MHRTDPIRPRVARRGRLLRWGWALGTGVLFVHLAAEAVAPLTMSWDLADPTQQGMLTIHNDQPIGGDFGMPVEIGDWNGDGFHDLAVAPLRASAGESSDRASSGILYVYPGDGVLSGRVIDPSQDPERITFWGARSEDLLGTELYTGDFDGDGIEDLIFGAQNFDGPDGLRTNAGAVYVLFGREDLFTGSAQLFDLAETTSGLLAIYGDVIGGRLGIWVESGDLDGDGKADLLLGADQVPGDDAPASEFHRGSVVVIYGRDRADTPAVLDLASSSGVEGISRIYGRDREDHFGASIHSADLNVDGRDDLIVASALERLSASQGEAEGIPAHGEFVGGDGLLEDKPEAGEVTILFSLDDVERLPPVVDLAAPPKELVKGITTIYGVRQLESMGEEITSGDFNGDGRPDLALGALTANGPVEAFAGKTYVLYWRAGLEGREIDLAQASGGFAPPGVRLSVLYGTTRFDILGDTLSAGDFNFDGMDDLAVGIPHAAVDDRNQAGSVAIVYGSRQAWPEEWAPQASPLPEGLSVTFILGANSFDLLSYSMEARDYDRDGYADLFPNAMTADGRDNNFPDAGDAYVISGYGFSRVSLRIDTLSPDYAHVSQESTVTVEGQGFTAGDVQVEVGGHSALDVTVKSGATATAVFPPGDSVGAVDVTVTTRYGSFTFEDGFRYLDNSHFLRGDAEINGQLNISDPIAILRHLFAPNIVLDCPDAGDSNDDGDLDLSDVIYLLEFLFVTGSAPAAPYPDPGEDPTADALSCIE